MNKVSIIIPSYNHAHFHKERLDSIINQSYQNFELIIIDDCSTDDSCTILNSFVLKYPDKIKCFITNEKNSGSGYQSWKKGIELAETEYIWIAETDDMSDKTFLEEMVKILDAHENLSLVFCGSHVINEKGEVYANSDRRTAPFGIAQDEYCIRDIDFFLNNMPFKTFITNANSVVFRKPVNKIPDELFSFAQTSDTFIWTYLIQEKPFAFLNKKLNYFRRHQNSTTIKMYGSKMKVVYEEKVQYLNYFNLNHKFDVFVKQYIQSYIWNNKKKALDTKIISKFDKVSFPVVCYFYNLFIFLMKKMFVRK
ncbi:MAG: glycosyltransferase [Candidatus Kapabacteria bacterium]|jgi:glycosyltransferase involved in cell wall biosynthesis|nr:glycosyltransferase [Candidatus Kapabacteria bacterium]